MKPLHITWCLVVLITLFAAQSYAQIETPKPSPLSKMKQKVGLTDITIEYSRPSMKGRKIYGDLVPFGTMWRTGANASTKITFSDDVKVEGNEVAAGTYALYATPGAAEWQIVLYKNTSHWGVPKEYKAEEEAARFSVKPEKMPFEVETMLFNVGHLRDNHANIELIWEKTIVSFRVDVEVESRVMKGIEKAMAGTTRGDYYVAARYYYDNDKELGTALDWIRKANEIDEKFWQRRMEALILAKRNNYKEAIKTAERSTVLAKEAGNESYVRMNQKSIAEWTAKMGGKKTKVRQGGAAKM